MGLKLMSKSCHWRRVMLAVINAFATVHEPLVHTPTVGYSLTLHCSPPHSYPTGIVYWGYSQPRSTKLDAIETDDRVLLDYDGSFVSVLSSWAQTARKRYWYRDSNTCCIAADRLSVTLAVSEVEADLA